MCIFRTIHPVNSDFTPEKEPLPLFNNDKYQKVDFYHVSVVILTCSNLNRRIMQKTSIPSQSILQELIPVLMEKGYQTKILHSEKEVKDFINNTIPDNTIIGLGDSITTCKLNIRYILAAKGSNIYYSWDGSGNYNRSLDTFEVPVRPDYYITRISALTASGEILMKDYDKGAVAENNFPLHVLAFAGFNRLTKELDDRDSISKYPIINHCPENTEFTVVLLPFLDY